MISVCDPMDEEPKNITLLDYIVVAVCYAILGFFIAFAITPGGKAIDGKLEYFYTADQGKIEYDRYYCGSKGRYQEVPRQTYILSSIYMIGWSFFWIIMGFISPWHSQFKYKGDEMKMRITYIIFKITGTFILSSIGLFALTRSITCISYAILAE